MKGNEAMIMTSRFTLLAAAGLAGLALVGCSGGDEEGDIPPAPINPPSGMVRGAGGTGQVGNAGTGGTGVTAGGTGGTGVTAGGTGGTGVAAGGAGGAPAGGGNIPVGTGFAITPGTDGWVAGTTNGVGIQGSFYPFGDYQNTPAGDTEVTLGAFDTPTSICLSGTASQVQGTPLNYTQYYGGGVALNLADPGGGGDPLPWARGSVTGFSFTITGPTIPANIRFNATIQGSTDPYCVDDVTTGAQTSIQFGTLTAACYNAGGAALPAAQALVAIQWQVVTNETAATPFDFCINNLTALTQ